MAAVQYNRPCRTPNEKEKEGNGMKKHRLHDIVLGMVIMALVMGLAMPALASNVGKTLYANYMDIKLVIDGVEVVPKDAGGNIVEPFVVDGTTYLPVRAVGEALGKEVTWDGNTKTVYLGAVPAGAIKDWVGIHYVSISDPIDPIECPHIATAVEETNARLWRSQFYTGIRPADAHTTACLYLEYHTVQMSENDVPRGELWITGLGDYFGYSMDGREDYLKLVRAILEDTISDSQDIESIMGQVQRIHDAYKVFWNGGDDREWALKEFDEVLGSVYKLNTVEVEWGNYPGYLNGFSREGLLRIRNK